jgi:hypothetical protein
MIVRHLHLLALLAIAGCSSSNPGVDLGDQPDLTLPSPFCTCGAGTSCLRSTVTRTASTATLPWVMFAAQGGSDGIGTLVAVARPPGGGTVLRQTRDPFDLTVATASASFDFGCVDLGTWTMGAFLDDNGNAAATDTSSSDFHDACPANRAPTQQVKDAAIANTAIVLANSCD